MMVETTNESSRILSYPTKSGHVINYSIIREKLVMFYEEKVIDRPARHYKYKTTIVAGYYKLKWCRGIFYVVAFYQRFDPLPLRHSHISY